MGRDTSIVQQVAYKAATELVTAMIAAGAVAPNVQAITPELDALAQHIFEQLKTEVDESAPAKSWSKQPGYSRPQASTPGEVTLNAGFKKHAGKTIAQVQADDPSYLDWILEKSPNDFIKDKVKAFRAAA